jgi:hypothetical protein
MIFMFFEKVDYIFLKIIIFIKNSKVLFFQNFNKHIYTYRYIPTYIYIDIYTHILTHSHIPTWLKRIDMILLSIRT